MKRKFKLLLAYDGTGLSGWQVQKNGKTVQGALESILHQITGEEIRVQGSSRTDAGVHSVGQVAHFETFSSFTAEKIQSALNDLLPSLIVVRKIEEVPLDFHARFDVYSKSYSYFILNQPLSSPFLDRYAWHISRSLDWEKMNEALLLLQGEHDFASFQSVGTPVKSTVREIKNTKISQIESVFPVFSKNIHKEKLYEIQIEGTGFLKQMVRNIVGTLVDVGRLKTSVENFQTIFEARNRTLAGATAPAKGLVLQWIRY